MKITLIRDHINDVKHYKANDETGKKIIYDVDDAVIDQLNRCNAVYEIVKEPAKETKEK